MSRTKSERAKYMAQYRSKKREQETDANRVLRELNQSHREARKLIVDAMAQLRVGTKTYLDHITALSKLDKDHRAELVARGLSPADLRAATGAGWKFVCHVGGDGTITNVEVKPGQVPPRSATFPQRTDADRATIAELDDEFGDAKE